MRYLQLLSGQKDFLPNLFSPHGKEMQNIELEVTKAQDDESVDKSSRRHQIKKRKLNNSVVCRIKPNVDISGKNSTCITNIKDIIDFSKKKRSVKRTYQPEFIYSLKDTAKARYIDYAEKHTISQRS